jgi:hypothetical protein
MQTFILALAALLIGLAGIFSRSYTVTLCMTAIALVIIAITINPSIFAEILNVRHYAR